MTVREFYPIGVYIDIYRIVMYFVYPEYGKFRLLIFLWKSTVFLLIHPANKKEIR